MNVHLFLEPGALIARMCLLSTAQAAMVDSADYPTARSRISAAHQVDKAGNDKTVRAKEAKAAEDKAPSEAKPVKDAGEARNDNADAQRDANFRAGIVLLLIGRL
jgi:hypothetical protein